MYTTTARMSVSIHHDFAAMIPLLHLFGEGCYVLHGDAFGFSPVAHIWLLMDTSHVHQPDCCQSLQ